MITRENSVPVISNIFIHPGLSDHYAIMGNFNLKKPCLPTIAITSRQWKGFSAREFSQDIHNKLSHLNFENDELDCLSAYYETITGSILDRHAPLKTRIRKVSSESPWFNDDTREARKKCRQLERRWRRNKLEVHRQAYINERLKLKKMTRQAKKLYYSSKIQETFSDQKKLFGIVNELLHKPKVAVLPSRDSDKELANNFSNFFYQKIDTIRKSFFNHADSCAHVESQTIACKLSSFVSTDECEIRNIIMKSPLKSCNLDPIPTSLIKQNIHVFVPIFTKIVNMSLSSGSFPDSQKLAHVQYVLF